MNTSRRDVLKLASAAGVAAAVPLRGRAVPSRIREVAEAALAAAKSAGATYADVRVVRRRSERISTRDDRLRGVDTSDSFGVGVRLLWKGAWGFAATQDVTAAGAKGAAARAAEIARANARLLARPVTLAPVRPVRDTWQTPLTKDPFRMPMARKVDLLFAIDKAARGAGVAVSAVHASLHSLVEEKVFFSSEGAEIDQTICRINPGYSVTVAEKGDFESRDHGIQPFSGGFERVEEAGLVEDAPRVAREAREKLSADPVTPGTRDLVLLPSHLWLTIHESIGHSTELDRASGYEANFAGTSFATPDQTGKLRYAGNHVTFYADRTTPGALATVGYDDDGIPTHRWDVIRDGVLVDWQTTREQASWIGAAQGHACSYAESWDAIPFQRMPNLSLAPAKEEVTLDALIAGVTDGVLVDGRGSYSIDQQRLNFQFSGDFFWEIKDGKRTRPLRHVAYQSTTREFWHAMDAIGGPASWELGGSFYDGKGEPGQSNPVSHGCPPARFRKVNVLDGRGNAS